MGNSISSIDLFQQNEREEYESAYLELLDGGFTEEEIEKWFVYSSIQKAFVPTAEYQQRLDIIRRLREKEWNLYLEAEAAGVGELFLPERIKKEREQQQIDWENEELQQAYEEEQTQNGTVVETLLEEYPDVPDEACYNEELELHQGRISDLDKLGFNAIPTADNYQTFSYSLHGYEYRDCESLYHADQLLGVFFDERYNRGPKISRQEHIDKLLEIVKKEKLRLLLVYWENEGKPVWEVYLGTNYVRKQSNPYSYDGLVFDEEKLADMSKIIEESNGDGIDIGATQRLLLQRVVAASKKIGNREELSIRIEENIRQHGELADLVSLLQMKSSALSQAVQKMSVNGDISMEEQQKAYDLLDAYTDSLPQVAVMDFKNKARDYYRDVFDDLSPSSQMYLTTAAALESVISNEQFDICPVYAELGRVLENELDLRIFSEYIGKLLSLKANENKDIEEKVKGEAFQNIQRLLKRAKTSLFLPEANKMNALPELIAKKSSTSIFATELNAILEQYKYNKEHLCSPEQNAANQRFVRTRNEHTHPNPNMDMEHELMNLEQFKQETIARLLWLIGATKKEDQG